MEDLRKKYLAHLQDNDNVNFVYFKELCDQYGIPYGPGHTVMRINYVLQKIANKHPSEHNVCLIDEVQSSPEKTDTNMISDWSNLIGTIPNLDYLVALSPIGHDMKNQEFHVKPPEKDNVLARQLVVKHRNSFEVSSLMDHIRPTSIVAHGYLSSFGDKIDPPTLPEGRQHVWIVRKQENSLMKMFWST